MQTPRINHPVMDKTPAISRNSRMTYIDRAAGRTIPWGNDGGASRELFLRDHPTKSGRLLYRLSTTDIVGSSAFSAYPGYKRTITMLAGGPFTLDFDGKTSPHTLSLLAPFDFNGGWTTYCRLDGPRAHVLNVMADDDVSYAWRTLSLDATREEIEIETPGALLYCARGDTLLESDVELPTRQLRPGEMLAIEDGNRLKLEVASSTSACLFLFAFHVQAAWT